MTGRQYRESFQYDQLGAGNALPAFQTFVERYPGTTAPRERMLLIDQLIHAFHWSIKYSVPHRAAANNLIEGNHKQVIAFLDSLAYGDQSTPGTQETRAAWRNTAEEMQRFRQSGS